MTSSNKHRAISFCPGWWFGKCGPQHMGVSKNDGIPKSSILIRFSIINHPFLETSISTNLSLPRSLPWGIGLNAGIDLLLARATCRFGWNLVDGLWEGHQFVKPKHWWVMLGVTVWSYFLGVSVFSITILKCSLSTVDRRSFEFCCC